MSQVASPITYDFAAGPSLPASEHASLKDRVAQRVTDAATFLATVMRRPLSAELEELTLIEGRPVPGERLRIGAGAEHLGEVVMGGAALVGLADLVMGGSGWSEERAATDLERTLVADRLAGFVTVLLRVLDEDLPTVRLELAEDTPPLLGGLLRISVALVGPGDRYPLTVLVPLTSDREPEPATLPPPAEVAAAFAAVPVTVSLRFRPVVVSASELTDLDLGDVIPLDHSVAEPLVGAVDGRPILTGRPGRVGRRTAVEILDLIDRSEQ